MFGLILKMSRGSQASHERRSTAIVERLQQSDSEDEASVCVMKDSYVKHDSTALHNQWTSSEDSSRTYDQEVKTSLPRRQGGIEDTETESPDAKSNIKSHKAESHSAHRKARYFDIHASKERIASGSLGRRKKRNKQIERRKSVARPPTTDHDHDRANTGSSAKRCSDKENNFAGKSRKRKKKVSQDDEMPIAEILKKAQENALTKYEEPVPLPELTTDTIYIQGRSGFSAVKIGGSRRALRNDTTRATKGGEDRDSAETRTYTLIKVAITAQKFWKCTGLVYQGLLGGMAFLHFIMETFLEELNGWQKVTISKDLLAVFAWLFVVLGTRDNMLLTHLESMVQYASNAESPR
ncbi:uncharacterized protein LOC105833765 isoform X2 [Monomorium pharaonis]|uniref:uncharacterized protein LOC105833765 isoform X2 n=1 Tax=Monomorium pharaonis TaxID=307658 RepID=UPI00102E17A6|nr:uncharacterized protein LOC105833765 isoform X2 [Monomorium pharaonis]